MPLSHFEELGLLSLCGQVDLKFVNFFYGTNPGSWKSRFPYNRLLFILESDGASTFGDGIRSCRAERGSWFLLPPFQEITHDHNETMLHLSIHFRLTVCGGFELLSGRHAFFCGRDPVLVNGVISEIREKDALRLASGLCAWCWTVLHRVMPQVSSSAVPALYANPAYAELFDFFLETRHGRDAGRRHGRFSQDGPGVVRQEIHPRHRNLARKIPQPHRGRPCDDHALRRPALNQGDRCRTRILQRILFLAFFPARKRHVAAGIPEAFSSGRVSGIPAAVKVSGGA